jgi:ATP-dependent DNA helicase RecQ
LAERIPSNENNLLQIKKLTPSKVKKYGKEIFSIIKETCFEFGYESNIDSFSSSKPTNQKESTELLTLKLFNEDKSISEIAKNRNLSNSTIENHLCTLVCNGYIPLETFVPKDHYKNIVSILENMSEEIRLKPIKEQLGDGYSWFEIRCTKEYWEKSKKSN